MSVCVCSVGICSIISLAATDYWKGAILPLFCVSCVWFAPCCCLAAWLVLSLLWLLLDDKPLALSCCQSDRRAFAPVTAASCHLGPCTERGGQGHANGRTQDKVTHTLAYCLTDWLTWIHGFLSQGCISEYTIRCSVVSEVLLMTQS